MISAYARAAQNLDEPRYTEAATRAARFVRSNLYDEKTKLLFRSYRDSNISCFAATLNPLGSGSALKPPGLTSEVDNYYCTSVEISLFFDEVG